MKNFQIKPPKYSTESNKIKRENKNYEKDIIQKLNNINKYNKNNI